MTIEYANAYSNERLAHARMKRHQRDAALAYKPMRNVAQRPIRYAIGSQLINIGEHLSKRGLEASSKVTHIGHI
jgi:hypothetical protein